MKILLFALLVLFSYPSEAFIEARVHYGMNLTKDNSDPYSKHLIERAKNDLKSLRGIGADILGRLPAFPLGIGLRYNMLKQGTAKKESTETSISTKTLALLINCRLIDAQFFLGATGTVGLSHSFKFKKKQENTNSDDPITSAIDKKVNKKRAYSIGAEGGIHITDQFLAGIELGYQMMKAQIELLDKNSRWDNSELYVKTFLAVSF